ncbi:hypothetical protein ACH4SP_19630 [Streptomyces sp. NPDC021093]|uniref:hypothetical protein n=1 Tax=Streptomyces sp. NPDC021093 TaxID=3365112 RepID=UPI0037BC6C05
MLGNGLGPADFQLVLLRRMADHQPGLVEDARISMGVTLTEMREVNRRWQAMVRSPRARGAVQRYRSVLGPPEAVVRRKAGDLECEALLWPVPLWPTLRLEVLTGPDGTAWNEWLVRAPGEPGPALGSADDLVPWSATVDEVARAFPPVRMLDGAAPTRARLAVTLPGGRGREQEPGQGQRQERVAEFCWGLFQGFAPADGQLPRP